MLCARLLCSSAAYARGFLMAFLGVSLLRFLSLCLGARKGDKEREQGAAQKVKAGEYSR